VGVAGPFEPHPPRKYHNKQEEEGACHLEPQNAAHPAKGPQKTAHAPRHASGCASRSTSVRLGATGRGCSGLPAGGYPLAGHPPRNPQPDSQDAADAFSSHFVMMVAAPLAWPLFQALCISQLLRNADRSKVKKSQAAPRACFPRRPQPLEVHVTSRLRELIQQLGEAIHESVIESEQIAGVVQDIRQHGFDVLLMLEATIGLNDVASKENEEQEVLAGESGEEPFTQNDLSFLRSLRISIAGEEKSAADPDSR